MAFRPAEARGKLDMFWFELFAKLTYGGPHHQRERLTILFGDMVGIVRRKACGSQGTKCKDVEVRLETVEQDGNFEADILHGPATLAYGGDKPARSGTLRE